jgi:hypothetical protein
VTNQELIDYYKDLLILQYRGKTRARGQIDAFVKQVVADQLTFAVQLAFNIDTAEGQQLDIIGKYAGVQRVNRFITLNDSDFRTFIKLQIVKNSNGSSLYDIQLLINEFFADQVFVFDYQTMRMSYLIDEDQWSSSLEQLSQELDIFPFPMAVERGATIYAPALALKKFFGFRTYLYDTENNSLFNTYDDYQFGWPWLTYEYATYDTSTDYFLEKEDGGKLLQESGYEIIL